MNSMAARLARILSHLSDAQFRKILRARRLSQRRAELERDLAILRRQIDRHRARLQGLEREIRALLR